MNNPRGRFQYSHQVYWSDFFVSIQYPCYFLYINSLNLVYSTPETGDGDSCPILSENKLKFSRKHHEVFLKFVQTTEGFVQQIKQISRVCCIIVISPLTGFIVSDILAFCLSWFLLLSSQPFIVNDILVFCKLLQHLKHLTVYDCI